MAKRSYEVTTREVASIRFGMFTDEEVRKLSVKRITSPLTYDSFSNVIPDGLYDSAMGPVDANGRCGTCYLGASQCPGHFGHIELPVPVYNPLVFSTLYRLVKHTCLNCHQFKMGRQEMSKFLVKLSCLSRGDLVAASLINTSGAGPSASAMDQVFGKTPPPKQKKGAGKTPGSGKTPAAAGSSGSKGKKQQQQQEEDAEEEEEDEEADERLGADGDWGTGLAAYEAAYGEGSGRRPQQLPKTGHIQDALRSAVSDFFSRMPGSKCQNCGCTNPTIRKQGSTKLFKQYSRKALLQNHMRGIDVAAALGAAARRAAEDAAAAAADDAAAAGKKRKRGAAAGKAEQQQEDEQAAKKLLGVKQGYQDAELKKGEDMMDEDDEEQQEDAAAEAATPGSGKKGAAAAGGGGGHGGKVKAAEAAAAAALGKHLSLDDATKPKFMAPDEVESHVAALCRNESGVLRHIYGGADLAVLTRVAGTVARAAKADPGRLHKAFFLRALAVTPNRFRPPSVMGETKYEHTQNITMQRILQAVLAIQSVHEDMRQQAEAAAAEETIGNLTPAQVAAVRAQRRAEAQQRFMAGWLRLQNEVNALIDSTAADNTDQAGVRQQLEKKEGLFRKNMMGKRVNYAARSVISPDPYIGAGEIGVPPYFAVRLSFPEAVTPWNVEEMRRLVINGADTHPGALAVEDCRGQVVSLSKLDAKRREGIAKQLLNPSFVAGGSRGRSATGSGAMGGGRGKIVHRHLRDGDLMLTNRQPTLHKPGLMAHRARVLKGERTIRMHYANCSTFNADFDGDEINLHLPQDHLGRAEGYNIVHADRQFIVPTDGKPIRGLIQDHVVAGVMMTCRDALFTRADFSQLLFIACTPWRPGSAPVVHLGLPPPALLKPRQLWTGKQLISAVVAHFADGRPPLSFSSSSKVPVDYWGRGSDEGSFLFHKGQLLTGCLDKAQFGKFGLVHAMQELYGDAVAGAMLNALSRLLTAFLQHHGFTCGMDDLLLVGRAERDRAQTLAKAEPTALAGSAEVVRSKLVVASAIASGKVPASLGMKHGGRVNGLLTAERLVVAGQLEQHYCTNGAATGAVHDRKVTGVMHPLASEVIKACIPGGQAKPFPANCMALMTISGAKGSTVNFSQIACLLGQQELEGRRVPRTASGKTLPCFRAYDGGARAGGFVGDRFLTGLRPQEYYFHCMAGREGLVDTTVKTSRSGYLQRCLVKNLEALRVTYDGTVRDVCDGSIVQLYYGDDGLDVTKVSYMKQTAFLAANAASAAQQLGLHYHPETSDNNNAPAAAAAAAGEPGSSSSSKKKKKKQQQQEAEQHQHQHQQQMVLYEQLQGYGLFDERQSAVRGALQLRHKLKAQAAAGDAQAVQQLKSQLPLMSNWFPGTLGATSESFGDAVEAFCSNPSEPLLLTSAAAAAPAAAAAAAKAAAAAAAAAAKAAAAGKEGKKEAKRQAKQQQELLQQLVAQQALVADSRMAQMAADDFRALLQLKFMSALAAPGEAVGVIAAQSVGEPSTQMTLNTFHMAGRGEANVTLGIPRLREILMTAAPRIKTPTMTMPLLPSCTDAQAQLLTSRMRKLRLAECLRGIKMWERPAIPTPHSPRARWSKGYDLELRFHPMDAYPPEAELTWQQLADALTQGFIPQLTAALRKQQRRRAAAAGIASMAVAAAERRAGAGGSGDEEGAAADDGEGAGGSSRGAAKAARADADQADDDDRPEEAAEDEEADEELREGKLRFRGGRGEAATYDGPDEEDAEGEAAMDAELKKRLGESEDESPEEDEESDEADRSPSEGKDGSEAKRRKQEADADEPNTAAKEQQQQQQQDDEQGQNAAAVAGGKCKQQRLRAAAAAAAAGGKGKAAAAAAAGEPAADGSGGVIRGSSRSKGSDDEVHYQIDQERLRCCIQVVIPMDSPKLLMLELAEAVAAEVLVRHIPGIHAMHLLDPEKPGQPRRLQTEGINFPGIWQQQALLDVDNIACNDVHAVLTTYGVEAARATILREVQSVFGAYGIGVDPRHLGLIADFMTHGGGYRACNRLGIDSETSPLLKMSFETAAKFLMDAALSGGGDSLTTPAARLVVGRVAEVGTGCCRVLQRLDVGGAAE